MHTVNAALITAAAAAADCDEDAIVDVNRRRGNCMDAIFAVF